MEAESGASDLTRSQALLRRRLSLKLVLWEYFMIGITGFGGGLQGRFYHLAVSKHGWLDDEEFADVNASASLAPGGNASNVGIEIARRLRGVRGMIAAYLCLIVPGSVLMILVGNLYQAHKDNPAVVGAMQGLETAATALILYSATKLGLSSWRWPDYLIAVAACLGMYWCRYPLWVVLPILGGVSLLVRKWTGR